MFRSMQDIKKEQINSVALSEAESYEEEDFDSEYLSDSCDEQT